MPPLTKNYWGFTVLTRRKDTFVKSETNYI